MQSSWLLLNYACSYSLCIQMLQQLREEHLICWLLLLLDYARFDCLCIQMVRQLGAEQLNYWL